MMPTLLHAIARKAGAISPDVELLTRYLREQDHDAFEELLRRHGPLVWSVCRQMLPNHADAEDAFQAVFLALVRSAASIRDGRTVPAWLHGVAVRVATRARREFARRRARERNAASPEADRPVSDEAWESLVAALHEEVQRLPESERTAFVLCDLQGVSQPDAAARLGWPLGSVSGRLCKARRRLLDRLAARGVAPAAAVGIGTNSGTTWAVPEGVLNVVKSFPGAPAAASTAATALARSLVEGVTMRVKLVAATVMVVAALSLTGGAVWQSKADAQPPAQGDPLAARPTSPVPPLPPSPVPPTPAVAGAPAPTFAPGPGPGTGWGLGPVAWEYKFVDVKADRKEYEKVVTQHGKEGWELCGSERLGGAAELTLTFKKRTGGGHAFGPATFNVTAPVGLPQGIAGLREFVPGKPFRLGGDLEVLTLVFRNAGAPDVLAAVQKSFPKDVMVYAPPGGNAIFVVAPPAAMKGVTKLAEEFEAKGAKTGLGFPPPVPGMAPTAVGARPGGISVINLKHAKADELAEVLKKLFPNVEMTGDPRTNALIVRADDRTLEQLKEILSKLDVEAGKPK